MSDDADRHRLYAYAKAENGRLRAEVDRLRDCLNCTRPHAELGMEAAARALCAADYFRIEEPQKSKFIDAQWPTYATRAHAAVTAYLRIAT